MVLPVGKGPWILCQSVRSAGEHFLCNLRYLVTPTLKNTVQLTCLEHFCILAETCATV